jgi:hypothetical protein
MTPRRTANQSIVAFMSPVLSFKHSKNVVGKVINANAVLSKVKDHWEDFSVNTKKMSLIKLTEQEAREFIKGVVGDNESTRSQNVREKIYNLWAIHGIGRAVPACNGTLFGLVQSFCEYGDHYQTVRKSKYLDDSSASVETKTLGNAAKQKAKAWSMALTLARKKEKLTGLNQRI